MDIAELNRKRNLARHLQGCLCQCLLDDSRQEGIMQATGMWMPTILEVTKTIEGLDAQMAAAAPKVTVTT